MLFSKWMRFIKFASVGVVNTLLAYGIYVLCLAGFALTPGIAVALGYGAGMVNSYVWNTRWTFGRPVRARGQALRFLAVNTVLLGLSELCYALWERVVHQPLAAQAFNVIWMTAAGFLANRSLVFGKPSHKSGGGTVNQRTDQSQYSKPTPRSETSSPFVSVVVPAYNEEQVVGALFAAVDAVLSDLALEYELIFVNDGSTDGTLQQLQTLAALHTHVKIIDLSRNFGHQIGVTAGMEHAVGDVVVLLDADLQDPPELIADFLAKWREGYDVVYAIRQRRKGETWFKRVTAKLFYRLLNRATDVPIPLDTGDFRLMNRNVVDALCAIRETHRYVRGLVSWVGFAQAGVPYVRQERYAGTSKYPLRRMLKFAVDGMTSFSHVPLKWATTLGFYSAGFGFLLTLVILYLKLFTHRTIQGWTSLMVVMLFLGGIQLLMLGVLGEYIARIYDEVRQRPLYIVKGRYNMDRRESP